MRDTQIARATSAGNWARVRPWLAVRLALVTLALMLGAVLLPPQSAHAADVVVLEDLNLRDGPGVEYDVIAVLPAGTVVTVLDGPLAGWYFVTDGEIEGWASGVYLEGDAGTVTLGTLNLRDGPGFDYDIIAELPDGTPVELLGDAAEADGFIWVLVSVPGVGTGWVAEDYLIIARNTAVRF